MKYFILAGEASGDLHGANLIKSLMKRDADADIQAWGGDLMEAAGAVILKHYKELAFMGFVEVIKNLPTIFNNFKICKKEILEFNPDVLILIDYPGFNLRMAKWAFKNNIKVFYYISPQIWAWKTGRVETIEKKVDRMFVILPFEKAFYKKHGVEVDYCGHPLMDVVKNYKPSRQFFIKNKLNPHIPIIALLPGSRKQEINKMLNGFSKVFKYVAIENQIVIAGAPSIEKTIYEPFLEKHKHVKLVENQTYDLLSYSKAALVTSGTATLETALFNVPQVVCYTGNKWSYLLAKKLVNKDLKFIAMPNLIADKKIISELIQDDFNLINLRDEIQYCLSENGRAEILKGYELIHEKLNQGGASEKVTELMVQRLLVVGG